MTYTCFDNLSSYKVASDFLEPLPANQTPMRIDDMLPNAHDELLANRKLTLVLWSNVYQGYHFRIVDLVQSFIIKEKPNINHEHHLVKFYPSIKKLNLHLRSKQGTKNYFCALEVVRACPTDNELAIAIQQSTDLLNYNLIDILG